MATFTFDTAWIVAHLQNNANEALKQRIRDRLLGRYGRLPLQARLNRYEFFLITSWNIEHRDDFTVEREYTFDADDEASMSEGYSFPA